MKYPNFNEEKKFWKKGLKFVAGIDEAGRGPLAGPVVAGAVVFLHDKIKNLSINDSKKLTPKQREEVYNYFKKNPSVEWGIGIVSEKMIDKINILEATKLAMIKALRQAQSKLLRQAQGKLKKRVYFLIIDGNIKLDKPAFVKSFGEVKQKSIIKA